MVQKMMLVCRWKAYFPNRFIGKYVHLLDLQCVYKRLSEEFKTDWRFRTGVLLVCLATVNCKSPEVFGGSEQD
jgi:hypothetical protein